IPPSPQLFAPAPPQYAGDVHVPQSITLPQPSPCLPHVAPRPEHDVGLQTGPPSADVPVPHLLAPPPPQYWPFGHVPHWINAPQPSPCGPHSKPSCAHVFGVHVVADPSLSPNCTGGPPSPVKPPASPPGVNELPPLSPLPHAMRGTIVRTEMPK